jgi:hypothetical protein
VPGCWQSKEERRLRALEAQQRRQRWRAQADAEAELDWERYGKYDMLHEVLKAATSASDLQVLPPWLLIAPCLSCLLSVRPQNGAPDSQRVTTSAKLLNDH